MVDGALYSIANGRLDEAREIIGTALERQRETIRQLRNLSFALEPVVLRDHGFAPALRELADQMMAYSSSLDVRLDLDGAETLGKTAEVALYTIIRELIEQSVRRGPPTRIDVSLQPHRARAASSRRSSTTPSRSAAAARSRRSSSACASCTASSRSRRSRAPARRSASRCRRTRPSARSHYDPCHVRGKRQEQGLSAVRVVADGLLAARARGRPARCRPRVRGRRPHARRHEDRPVAVPRRHAPLRVYSLGRS